MRYKDVVNRILSLAAGLLLVNCQNGQRSKVEFSADRRRTLDAFMKNIAMQYRIPGIAYAIIHDDSMYCNAEGIKNRDGELLTVHTPIMAGKLSEPLLAYAVLGLEKAGKISLEDKVVQHLPYFKMRGDAYRHITIRSLLTHTSGIDDYTIFYDKPRFDEGALEVATRSIVTQLPKWNAPEIEILRSAYNYDILADLIQKVTGEPFEEYVHKNVFQPLGMLHSSFMKPDDAAQPFVTTDYLDYSFEEAKVYPYTRTNGGSRGLHASVQDLSNWMLDILYKDRFNHQFLETIYRNSEQTGVGYGWDIFTDEKGVDIYAQESEFGGFGNHMILIPSKNTGVLILTNINTDFNLSKVVNTLTSWLDNRTSLRLRIPIHIPMGIKLKETGRVEAALQEYKSRKLRQLEEYDFSEKSLLLLGTNVLKRQNSASQAIEIFKFCTTEYPGSAEAYLNLAEAYLYNRDLVACRLNMQKANEAIANTENRANFLCYLQERIDILEEKK